MKLIIRQYLALLKESGGLDSILPDLLLAMGIHPISKAQRGIRQYGVDVAAIGPDPDDGGKTKLFLLTIKRGDFGRTDWDDGSAQAVRPSLNEILDVYIPSHVAKEHKSLPIKIVVCAGGDLKQEIQLAWAQFIQQHSKANEIEFDFWGGEKLAIWIEQHLLNESLLPDEPRKHLRKAIALVGDPDYDLRDFYRLIDFFFERGSDEKPLSRDKCLAKIRNAILCTGIVIRWAQDEGDLRQAYIASERLLLGCWDFLRVNDCLDSKKLSDEILIAYSIFQEVGNALFMKLQQRCYIEDGFFVPWAGHIEYALRLYDFIGIFAVLGIDQMVMQNVSPASGAFLDNANAIVDTLAQLISNNGASFSPPFDWHANEIAMTLSLLAMTKSTENARNLIARLIGSLSFSFQSKSGFPVMTNSFDDLLAYRMGRHENPESLGASTSILPMLAEFCVVFGFNDEYSALVEHQHRTFKEVDYQIWQPDDSTDGKLYREPARDTGICFNSIRLPESLADFRADIIKREKQGAQISDISCLSDGMPILTVVASRHFRTPLAPQTWRQLIPREPSD
tara:strand:- start:7085 stop:8776 length:1692 start_codon:yes stop_codon:yes gene_type:complete